LEQWNRRQHVDSAFFADPYIGLGKKDQALAWLEKACAEHSITMTTLKVDPFFDPLRGDQRFQSLLQRVGLANCVVSKLKRPLFVASEMSGFG
jgi:hypothetical protein